MTAVVLFEETFNFRRFLPVPAPLYTHCLTPPANDRWLSNNFFRINVWETLWGVIWNFRRDVLSDSRKVLIILMTVLFAYELRFSCDVKDTGY